MENDFSFCISHARKHKRQKDGWFPENLKQEHSELQNVWHNNGVQYYKVHIKSLIKVTI